MSTPVNRTVSLSPARRLVCDVMHFSQKVPLVVIERRSRLPMLDLSLFRNPTFAGANLIALLVFFILFGIFFFMSIFTQGVLRYSAVETGASFLPMTKARAPIRRSRSWPRCPPSTEAARSLPATRPASRPVPPRWC